MSITSKLKMIQNRLHRYAACYGMWRGVHTLARAVCGRGLVSIQLPGCKDSILLRRHTTDIAAFEQVFIDREYDLPIAQKDPKWIVDAGANVGCASIFFAKQFPRASILAIEPETSNYSILERNGRRFRNITTIKAAIWNSDTELEIQNPTDDKWAFRVQPASTQGASKVRALSIPSILEKTGAGWIDILKVDIEGAEKEVFDETSAHWIDRVGVIIVELHDWIRPGCSDALSLATRGANWGRFQAGENTVLIRQ
jgi:FkbM family methyltransferase